MDFRHGNPFFIQFSDPMIYYPAILNKRVDVHSIIIPAIIQCLARSVQPGRYEPFSLLETNKIRVHVIIGKRFWDSPLFHTFTPVFET